MDSVYVVAELSEREETREGGLSRMKYVSFTFSGSSWPLFSCA